MKMQCMIGRMVGKAIVEVAGICARNGFDDLPIHDLIEIANEVGERIPRRGIGNGVVLLHDIGQLRLHGSRRGNRVAEVQAIQNLVIVAKHEEPGQQSCSHKDGIAHKVRSRSQKCHGNHRTETWEQEHRRQLGPQVQPKCHATV